MNNVRGVSFHVEQQNDDILRQVLGGVNVAAYNGSLIRARMRYGVRAVSGFS